jgi:5'-nucleotidase
MGTNRRAGTRMVAAGAAVLSLTTGGLAVAGPAGAATGGSTKPLTILVTNDDGYNAPGINALVQALRTLPKAKIVVVAPATNESGSGSKTTPGTLVTTKETTLSGYPAVAVQGYPADTIRAAVDQLHVKPTLVVSGVNLGQNLGPVLNLSGTVGAARAAAALGIPAIATSQGVGTPVDFPVTAKAVVRWITDHRSTYSVTKAPQATVVNINGPSCGTTGKPRGTVDVPPAASGNPLADQNCASTVTDPPDDVTALDEGYIVIDKIPTVPSTTSGG